VPATGADRCYIAARWQDERRRSEEMTKAEFVELIASDNRIESKKQASEAVEAVLDGISRALSRGESVNFTGFGKFHVAERGARQGVNPRTGERITIPGGRVPRFSAGAGLKNEVKG
jgi:DNA-binding protein HU-beta